MKEFYLEHLDYNQWKDRCQTEYKSFANISIPQSYLNVDGAILVHKIEGDKRELVAWADYFYQDSITVKLNFGALREDMRGKHESYEIMDAILGVLSGSGAKIIRCDTLNHNVPAIRLCLSNGFLVTGSHIRSCQLWLEFSKELEG